MQPEEIHRLPAADPQNYQDMFICRVVTLNRSSRMPIARSNLRYWQSPGPEGIRATRVTLHQPCASIQRSIRASRTGSGSDPPRSS
jgi:hypothetical protein